ncbi:MAG TPA: PaaI family thioesterase [Terriglobales bacterium]|nr:PaaI family thioesterase [Terriglobales bacterium]
MSKESPGRGHSTRYAQMQKNYCFACGDDNAEGMHLKFEYDQERRCFVCHLHLDQRFTGPPGHCHGGIIATILDEAMGKVNRLREVVAVTKEMTVHFLKPVPLRTPLIVESREVSVHGRQHVNSAEILDHNRQVLARGEGTFIAIDPEKMFGRFVEK